MAPVNRLTSDKADKDLWHILPNRKGVTGACMFQSQRVMRDGSNDCLTEYQNYVFDFYFFTYLDVSSATEMEMQPA